MKKKEFWEPHQKKPKHWIISFQNIWIFQDAPCMILLMDCITKVMWKFCNTKITRVYMQLKTSVKSYRHKIFIPKISKAKYSTYIIITFSGLQHSYEVNKDNVDIFADFLCKNIISAFKFSSFLSCLKAADMTPLHECIYLQ